jgi:hypothetical protein
MPTARSRITFLTLTIVGRSRGDVSSHQDVFQTFGFPEGQDGWFFEDFTQFWMFLYGCLSPQSCHPKHCTKSIPYSQALRIKRIYSNEQTTKKRLGELKCHLKKRGYNNASINQCFNKASGIDRKDLIQYKEKNANNRVPFVITYHPALSNLSSIVREHWTTIQKPPELCKICLSVGLLYEFEYHTVFNNILTVLFYTFIKNVSFLYLFFFLILKLHA